MCCKDKGHDISMLNTSLIKFDVNKVLKTPKKMFTITSFTTGTGSSLIVNLKLKILSNNYQNRWEGL